MNDKWKASKIKDDITRQKSYEEAKGGAEGFGFIVNCSSWFEDVPQLIILLLLDTSIRQSLYGTLTFFSSVINAAYKGHKIMYYCASWNNSHTQHPSVLRKKQESKLNFVLYYCNLFLMCFIDYIPAFMLTILKLFCWN
jgi:hypothetical protein